MLKVKTLKNFEVEKTLHNRKLQLKGNIRVFCRIRPILQSEIDLVSQKLQTGYMPHSAKSKKKVAYLKGRVKAGESV